MNLGQLQAWAQQNRTAVIGVAGAGVVVLALRAKNKKSATPAAGVSGTALTTGPNLAGTVPYNSSSSDAYNALMPAIEQLYSMQQGGSPVPVPVAAGMTGPSYNGKVVRYADGSTFEVEGDGSLLGLTPGQFNAVVARGKQNPDSWSWTQLDAPVPTAGTYTTASNLADIAKRNAAAAAS